MKNMLDKSDKQFITEAIKGALVEERKTTKKFVHDEIETAVGQLVSAMVVGFKEADKKLNDGLSPLKDDVSKLKDDVSEIKIKLGDLQVDSPSKLEFQGHEKRIGRLEKAVFTP